MATLSVYVDDETHARLARASRDLARPIEELAESAVSEAALAYDKEHPADAR